MRQSNISIMEDDDIVARAIERCLRGKVNVWVSSPVAALEEHIARFDCAKF